MQIMGWSTALEGLALGNWRLRQLKLPSHPSFLSNKRWAISYCTLAYLSPSGAGVL